MLCDLASSLWSGTSPGGSDKRAWLCQMTSLIGTKANGGKAKPSTAPPLPPSDYSN